MGGGKREGGDEPESKPAPPHTHLRLGRDTIYAAVHSGFVLRTDRPPSQLSPPWKRPPRQATPTHPDRVIRIN